MHHRRRPSHYVTIIVRWPPGRTVQRSAGDNVLTVNAVESCVQYTFSHGYCGNGLGPVGCLLVRDRVVEWWLMVLMGFGALVECLMWWVKVFYGEKKIFPIVFINIFFVKIKVLKSWLFFYWKKIFSYWFCVLCTFLWKQFMVLCVKWMIFEKVSFSEIWFDFLIKKNMIQNRKIVDWLTVKINFAHFSVCQW